MKLDKATEDLLRELLSLNLSEIKPKRQRRQERKKIIYSEPHPCPFCGTTIRQRWCDDDCHHGDVVIRRIDKLLARPKPPEDEMLEETKQNMECMPQHPLDLSEESGSGLNQNIQPILIAR